MLREQMINFLESAVVFLLATNAASALAALYAMRLANAVRRRLRPRASSHAARRHDPAVELTRMRVSGASNGCSDIDLATGENPMTTLAKTLAAAVIGLSASMFAPITASAALSANATARCNAQVRAVWPQSGVEYERTKEDVFQACVLNGGRIP